MPSLSSIDHQGLVPPLSFSRVLGERLKREEIEQKKKAPANGGGDTERGAKQGQHHKLHPHKI